jgi:predicted aspartyl protease
MRRSGLALLCGLLTGLAGCGMSSREEVASPGASATGQCRIERAADLPVRLVAGTLLVPAEINGHAVQMVVDTGSARSMILPQMAGMLGLRGDPHRMTTVRGLGGQVTTRNVLVDRLALGGREWLFESVPTGELPRSFMTESPPVVGLLGGSHIGVYDIELNLPNHRLALWDVSNCSGDFVPWPMRHYVLPLHDYGLRRMATPVTLQGRTVTALIDWGTRVSMVDTATAARLGVTAADMARDPGGNVRGADQNATPVHMHHFTDLRIGPEHLPVVPLLVGDVKLYDVAMLLGLDYAMRRRLWLSYHSGQLFVGPVGMAPRR